MKIINKYILEEIKGPIILSVFVFTFIFLLDIVVAMMENIIVKGISILDVFRLLSFYIPPILTQTIPIGLFLGIMICFTKFSRNSESVAMISIGMSIKEILKPILLVAISMSFFIFFLQESIIPRSFIKLRYLGAKIAYENPIFQLKEKTFINNLDDYSLYIDEVDSKGVAQDIVVFQKNSKNDFPIILFGEKAFWKDASITLKDANFIDLDEEGKKKLTGTFKQKKVSLNAYFSDLHIKIKEVEALSIKDLIKELKLSKNKDEVMYKVEIFRKLALVLSTIPLAILGVILSMGHHRNSRKYAFVIALTIVFSYVILMNMGIVLANSKKLNPFIATWTPNILLYILSYKMYKLKEIRGI